MPLIQLDLMADMKELPLAALVLVTLLGIGFYSTGWLIHRFWIGLTATFVAGLVGLRLGGQVGIPPAVAGLLMAAAAGITSLALARVAIFILFGTVCWWVVQLYAPRFEVPLACFLVGGLVSMLLFRMSVRFVTVFMGSVGIVYGALPLLEKLAKVNAASSLGKLQPQQLNMVFFAITGAGLLVQMVAEQSWEKYKKNRKDLQAMRQKQEVPKPPPSATKVKAKALASWFKKAA